MANPKHLDVLRQGVEAWNQWREENPEIRPDLSGTELRGIELPSANLTRANLGGTRLLMTDVSGADLRTAEGLTQERINTAQGDGDTK